MDSTSVVPEASVYLIPGTSLETNVDTSKALASHITPRSSSGFLQVRYARKQVPFM